MHPRTLLESEVKSKGEKRVFDALRDGLDDSWEAFHSVGWVTRDHAEGSDDGEIDFVLARVGAPIICLEVKGGGLECRHGEWFRLKDGKQERFRDPFAQAVDHTYALGRKLDEFDSWKERRRPHRPGALVPRHLRPQARARARRAGRDRHRQERRRRDRRPRSTACSPSTAARATSASSSTSDGLEALRDILAPNVRIEVPMSTQFLDEEEQMITLTHEQASLLNRFARERRLAVYGCAGSGKTMLAVEQAKRLAAKGETVLFVCFNTRLTRPPARPGEGLGGRVPELPRPLPTARRQGRGRAAELPEGRGAAGVLLRGAPARADRGDRRRSGRSTTRSSSTRPRTSRTPGSRR